jgi:hypothetical protein
MLYISEYFRSFSTRFDDEQKCKRNQRSKNTSLRAQIEDKETNNLSEPPAFIFAADIMSAALTLGLIFYHIRLHEMPNDFYTALILVGTILNIISFIRIHKIVSRRRRNRRLESRLRKIEKRKIEMENLIGKA